MKLYNIFDGEELKIAELIQRRRLQILVHSYIYYERNDNLISDSVFDKWCTELVALQRQYKHIAEKVPYHDAFESWEGSTGAFLPYKSNQIIVIADRLLRKARKQPKIVIPQQKKPTQVQTTKKKLF